MSSASGVASAVSTVRPPGDSTSGQVLPLVMHTPPWTVSFQFLGAVLVPISTPPMKVLVARVDVAKYLSATTPDAPTTESVAYGEVVPTPTMPVELAIKMPPPQPTIWPRF